MTGITVIFVFALCGSSSLVDAAYLAQGGLAQQNVPLVVVENPTTTNETTTSPANMTTTTMDPVITIGTTTDNDTDTETTTTSDVGTTTQQSTDTTGMETTTQQWTDTTEMGTTAQPTDSTPPNGSPTTGPLPYPGVGPMYPPSWLTPGYYYPPPYWFDYYSHDETDKYHGNSFEVIHETIVIQRKIIKKERDSYEDKVSEVSMNNNG